jgi:hypothetical protein
MSQAYFTGRGRRGRDLGRKHVQALVKEAALRRKKVQERLNRPLDPPDKPAAPAADQANQPVQVAPEAPAPKARLDLPGNGRSSADDRLRPASERLRAVDHAQM